MRIQVSLLLFLTTILFTTTVSARLQITKRSGVTAQVPANIIHSDLTPESSTPITQDPAPPCPGHLISINAACHSISSLPAQFAIHYATHIHLTTAHLRVLQSIIYSAILHNDIPVASTLKLARLHAATTAVIESLNGEISNSGREARALKRFSADWAGVEGVFEGLSEGQFREVEKGVEELVKLQRENGREVERIVGEVKTVEQVLEERFQGELDKD